MEKKCDDVTPTAWLYFIQVFWRNMSGYVEGSTIWRLTASVNSQLDVIAKKRCIAPFLMLIILTKGRGMEDIQDLTGRIFSLVPR